MPPTKAPSKRERRAQRIGLRYPSSKFITSRQANLNGLDKMILLHKSKIKIES